MLCDFYNKSQQYQENLLSKYYKKQGHVVIIIASTFESIFDYMEEKYNRSIKESECIVDGVKIIKLPYSINLFNKLRKFNGVNKILEKEEPDIIFSHSIHLNLYEAVKYKKKNPKCKIIMDYHGDYSNSGKNWFSINILHKIIRKRILYSVLRYIDKIYTIVPAGYVFLNKLYSIPYSKMDLLPLGVDIDKSNEVRQQNKGKAIREKYGITADDFVIFTGGKLDLVKRTDIIIEAINILSDSRIHLFIVGAISENNVPYKERLEGLIKGNQRIHFTGWLDGEEIYDYMNASDIAIFPASQSVLWQQSIGMGLPLIIGTVVHVNEIIFEQDADYLNVNNNVIVLDKDKVNSQEIAKHIKRLIDDPDLLNMMKKGAIKTSEEFLSYDIIVKKTLEVVK